MENFEASKEIQQLKKQLEDKSNEADSLRSKLAKETADQDNKEIQKLQKEIQQRSDQLAFFKAKLAEKEKLILELQKGQQEGPNPMRTAKSTVGDAGKTEPAMDLDVITDSPQKKRKRLNQRQRRRKQEEKKKNTRKEAPLQVVLRGVTETLSEDAVREDLSNQGFHPNKVTRWRHREKGPLPLVLVSVPRDEERIYKINEVNKSKVQPEALKVTSRFTQCYNCQRFGHTAHKCQAGPKCVKCGAGHDTRSCTKPSNTQATCANCGGAHPASFMGCRSHPKHKQGPSSRRWPNDLGNLESIMTEMNKNMQLFFNSLKNIHGSPS